MSSMTVVLTSAFDATVPAAASTSALISSARSATLLRVARTVVAVSGAGLTHTGSVPVGLEPIAVAARSNTEVWVVNHLSDSVSIVDVGTGQMFQVRDSG